MGVLHSKVYFLLLVIWVGLLSVWMGSYLREKRNKVVIPYRDRNYDNWADITDEEANFMVDAFEELSDRIKQERSLKIYLKAIMPELGDLGKPAYLSKHFAHYVTKVLRMKGINVLLSNKMRLDRRLPDVRYPLCKTLSYDIKQLPLVSIIVPFHDVPGSIIVRALHSIARETPPELLKEIILVDDKSEADELHAALRHYVRTLLPVESDVILVRLHKRYGVVKARLEGARTASGVILVFLDPHIEVTKGWLEPLLQRIKEKGDAVVMPIIDTISPMTFEYQPQNDTKIIGGFTWGGKATWIDIPKRLMNTQRNSTDPIETPVMMNAIFAVHKIYFLKFGSYDVDMVGSGGENLEMSFRTWQCGGSLEVIPCSRVGHLFRGSLSYKYKFPSNTSAELFDLARTVNMWMDDYSRLFYLHHKEVEYGNIEDRLMLREILQCKSFEWYLENIYPEKFISDQNVTAYGKVRSKINNLCLDVSKLYTERTLERLKVAECKKNETTHNQFFSLTNSGQLRTEFRCVSIARDASKVEMRDCGDLSELMKWKLLEDGSLVHSDSGLCLDATNMKANQEIIVNLCNKSSGQTWKFDYYS